MGSILQGKTVVITGGTGSFGRAAAKRLLSQGVGEIRVFSRDELKQDDMRQEFRDPRLVFYLGDIRDRSSVDGVMQDADLAFHAAALKQVPSCEFFPMQAVQTNVEGSNNVVQGAIAAGLESIVCLGTDKAAYPINTMGLTKALMEKTAQAAARLGASNGTVVSTVRYGNVMASRGSVIPLFIKQIQSGGPLTVTEPSMTRFLLPLPEALDLVLFAFEHASPGDLFVRKSPACTIADLAAALRAIFRSDVEEAVIGMRHGEKLFETLATQEELSRAQDIDHYFRIKIDDRDLNYNLYFNEGNPDEAYLDDYTSHNAQQLTLDEVRRMLLTLPDVQEALEAANLEVPA